MLQFSNHVNTIIENVYSVPNLSSVLEFVCDHQQAPAMKSLIANGYGKQHCKPFCRSQWIGQGSSCSATINCKQTDAQLSMSIHFERCMSVHLFKLHQVLHSQHLQTFQQQTKASPCTHTGTISCQAQTLGLVGSDLVRAEKPMTIDVQCIVSVPSLSSALKFYCDHLNSVNQSNTRSKELLKKWQPYVQCCFAEDMYRTPKYHLTY